jgi:nitrate/nitrite-specific signal transduction histidine kinase
MVPVQAQVTDLNDAINKAGRQRMLSQRLAKSWCAIGLNVLPDLARETLQQSMAVFDRQLAELKAFAPSADIRSRYQTLEPLWSDYKAVLVGSPPAKERAPKLFALAGLVLQAAHQGTVQLEQASGRPLGRLVNIAGRQRMLSQRMAAFYFAACWDVQARAALAELNTAHDEFAAAHELLKKAPEATPAIRNELAQAEAQFVFFAAALRALRHGEPDARSMANIFTTSERILQTMDGVTGMFSKQGLPA